MFTWGTLLEGKVQYVKRRVGDFEIGSGCSGEWEVVKFLDNEVAVESSDLCIFLILRRESPVWGCGGDCGQYGRIFSGVHCDV